MSTRPLKYAPVLSNNEFMKHVANWRRKRLLNYRPIRTLAYLTDITLALGIPVAIGVGLAAGITAILQNVDGARDWILQTVHSEAVLNSLGVMLAFLVTSSLNTNLHKNNTAIAHFSNMAGGCLNMAIWSRSMLTNNQSLKTATLPDGFGGYYVATEIGLILSSIPFIVKYTYRGSTIRYQELPLGSVPSLLNRVLELTNPGGGRTGVSGFTACVMLVGEQIDLWEASGAIKAPELVALFHQLDALTADEGTVGGAVAYDEPGAMTFLMYLSFLVYYTLLIVSDLSPQANYNSMWIAGVLIVSSFGLYAISVRYANPFAVRTGNSTQKPLISQACRQTEVAITAVFARPRQIEAAVAAGAALSLGIGIR